MAIYEIGGNQVPVKTSEAIADIPANRTLFVQQLTKDPPAVPEAVHNLQTINDVFAHFNPSCEVELEREDGTTVNEKLHFYELGDFKPSQISKKSKLLNETAEELRIYEKICKQLQSNKVLHKLLQDPSKKEVLIEMLRSLAGELEDKK